VAAPAGRRAAARPRAPARQPALAQCAQRPPAPPPRRPPRGRLCSAAGARAGLQAALQTVADCAMQAGEAAIAGYRLHRSSRAQNAAILRQAVRARSQQPRSSSPRSSAASGAPRAGARGGAGDALRGHRRRRPERPAGGAAAGGRAGALPRAAGRRRRAARGCAKAGRPHALAARPPRLTGRPASGAGSPASPAAGRSLRGLAAAAEALAQDIADDAEVYQAALPAACGLSLPAIAARRALGRAAPAVDMQTRCLASCRRNWRARAQGVLPGGVRGAGGRAGRAPARGPRLLRPVRGRQRAGAGGAHVVPGARRRAPGGAARRRPALRQHARARPDRLMNGAPARRRARAVCGRRGRVGVCRADRGVHGRRARQARAVDRPAACRGARVAPALVLIRSCHRLCRAAAERAPRRAGGLGAAGGRGVQPRAGRGVHRAGGRGGGQRARGRRRRGVRGAAGARAGQGRHAPRRRAGAPVPGACPARLISPSRSAAPRADRDRPMPGAQEELPARPARRGGLLGMGARPASASALRGWRPSRRMCTLLSDLREARGRQAELCAALRGGLPAGWWGAPVGGRLLLGDRFRLCQARPRACMGSAARPGCPAAAAPRRARRAGRHGAPLRGRAAPGGQAADGAAGARAGRAAGAAGAGRRARAPAAAHAAPARGRARAAAGRRGRGGGAALRAAAGGAGGPPGRAGAAAGRPRAAPRRARGLELRRRRAPASPTPPASGLRATDEVEPPCVFWAAQHMHEALDARGGDENEDARSNSLDQLAPRLQLADAVLAVRRPGPLLGCAAAGATQGLCVAG